MADDKKTDSSPAASPPPELTDDWDSLPLDPEGDDWDDLPPPKAAPAPGPESTSPPVMAAPIPPAADPPSAPKLPPGAAPPPDSGQIFALLGADDEFKTEDFGDHLADEDDDLDDSALPLSAELDEFDLPAGLAPGAWIVPDEGSTETPDEEPSFDLDLASYAAQEAEPTPAAADDDDDLDGGAAGVEDFDGLNEPEDAAAAPAAKADVGAGEPDPDDFNAHLEAMALDGEVEPAGEPEKDPDSASIMDKIETELEDLPTKKVELDIEGIFLDDHEPPPAEEEEEEAEPPPEPEAPAEAAPPPAVPVESEASPVTRKIPKLKLLLLLVPALLLVFGLGFGLYKLFFSSPPAEEAAAPLVIDPTVPPREPAPGTLDLGAFYVNFPGERSETIMEMAVVLHYKDLPDRAAIEARLPLVRDIIYLVAQGQGSQVISNGEAQRQLRQIAAEEANAALGGEHIDYVQISQIRILQ